jgi:Bifunctional DNA primase/polymerase, N-terminal/Primase C terminal 2 (PriCT-2)
MNPTPEFTFPCNSAKKPLVKEWQKSEFQRVEWKRAELVGARTGARNGFDVLDVDIRHGGVAWYDANFDALPQTFAQASPGGLHLYFRHAPGLRCSTGRIAPGIDLKTEGGFVIVWSREGLPFEEHPLCEMPDWLRAEAIAASGRKAEGQGGGTPSTLSYGFVGTGVEVADATAALRQLDPCAWAHRHDEWFALLMGAKAAGIGVEDFVEWSTRDPEYAGDAEIIRGKWNSIGPRHPGAFFKALKDAEIKLTRKKWKSAGGSTPPTFTPTIDVRGRTKRLLAWLATAPTDDHLFRVAATFGEIILEKRMQRWVANDLLEGACQANGLWELLGPDRCRRTIANGFRHAEEKFLGERE